jgi:hypothetical protein
MKSQCTVNSELFRENTAMKIQLEYFWSPCQLEFSDQLHASATLTLESGWFVAPAGPRKSLKAVEQKKIIYSSRQSNIGQDSSPLLYRLSYCDSYWPKLNRFGWNHLSSRIAFQIFWSHNSFRCRYKKAVSCENIKWEHSRFLYMKQCDKIIKLNITYTWALKIEPEN